MTGMPRHVNVPLRKEFVEKLDSRRGVAKRATYVAALIQLAWDNGLEV